MAWLGPRSISLPPRIVVSIIQQLSAHCDSHEMRQRYTAAQVEAASAVRNHPHLAQALWCFSVRRILHRTLAISSWAVAVRLRCFRARGLRESAL